MLRSIAELHNLSILRRYGIAADLVGELLPDIKAAAAAAPGSLVWPPQKHNQNHDTAWRGAAALSGLVAVTVWLRLSSLRLLTWNHNYNVKPREISAALDRLGERLVEVRGSTSIVDSKGSDHSIFEVRRDSKPRGRSSFCFCLVVLLIAVCAVLLIARGASTASLHMCLVRRVSCIAGEFEMLGLHF
jgi:hypothetical protein